MSKNFMDRVAQGREGVEVMNVEQAKAAIEADSNALVLDVRDTAELAGTGVIPGSACVTLGTLFYKADQEMPEGVKDARLEDKSRQILCTCAKGGQASIAAGVLKEYGYENVKVIEGGVLGWKEAGYDTEEPK